VVWRFEPVAGAAFEARRRVRALLCCWGLSDDDVDVALMVASELVSNAVDHARTPLTVSVSRRADVLRVAVRDHCDAPPLLRAHDPFAARGRGLQMVDALASHWDCTPDPAGRGKTVWAEISPC
jgi:anti-sigma regulatory factor (Ser/Thr protein kinase)